MYLHAINTHSIVHSIRSVQHLFISIDDKNVLQFDQFIYHNCLFKVFCIQHHPDAVPYARRANIDNNEV